MECKWNQRCAPAESHVRQLKIVARIMTRFGINTRGRHKNKCGLIKLRIWENFFYWDLCLAGRFFQAGLLRAALHRRTKSTFSFNCIEKNSSTIQRWNAHDKEWFAQCSHFLKNRTLTWKVGSRPWCTEGHHYWWWHYHDGPFTLLNRFCRDSAYCGP